MNYLVYRIVPWTIILAPFLVLGVFYNSLPADIIVFRHLDGTFDYAPKSVFIVFRVPLIEVVCAFAIEIMRGKSADVPAQKSYFLIWTILLYTVAAKTLLQAAELISSKDKGDIFFYLTAGAVLTGIVTALIAGRGVFSNFDRGAWKLGAWRRLALFGLLAGYLFLAFATF